MKREAKDKRINLVASRRHVEMVAEVHGAQVTEGITFVTFEDPGAIWIFDKLSRPRRT